MKDERLGHSTNVRRWTTPDGRDDSEYWHGLERRIHDAILREASRPRHVSKSRNSDAAVWLAARSRAASLVAIAAAVAAAIIVASLQAPARQLGDPQRLWESALVSGSTTTASDSLKIVPLSGSVSPSISLLMIGNYDASSGDSRRSVQ